MMWNHNRGSGLTPLRFSLRMLSTVPPAFRQQRPSSTAHRPRSTSITTCVQIQVWHAVNWSTPLTSQITPKMATRKQRTALARARKAAHYRTLGIAWRIRQEFYPLLAMGMNQRQIAEALNAKGVPTPSQWEGMIGDTRITSHKHGRKVTGKWSQTQVCRTLKNIEEVTQRMRWWKRWVNKEQIAALEGTGKYANWDSTRLYYRVRWLLALTEETPRQRRDSRAKAARGATKRALKDTRGPLGL